MVDPYGRVLADQTTPEGGPLTLVADVPIGTPNAPNTRLGDWVGWLALAG
jgi:apolipoprotein N-acyltransferase